LKASLVLQHALFAQSMHHVHHVVILLARSFDFGVLSGRRSMHFEADNNAFELSLPAMLHRDACMFPLRPCICYHPRNKRPSL